MGSFSAWSLDVDLDLDVDENAEKEGDEDGTNAVGGGDLRADTEMEERVNDDESASKTDVALVNNLVMVVVVVLGIAYWVLGIVL